MPELVDRAPLDNAPLSLVLVACNAAGDLEAVTLAWITELIGIGRPFEVILVDDGSTDETALLADALAATDSRIRIIHHTMRRGFGDALGSGIVAAKHPLVAMATCDRQYDPAELKNFIEKIGKVDLVTGYRMWLPVPPLLQSIGTIWRLFVRGVFGIPLGPLPSWLGDHGQLKRWFARWFFGVRVHDVECAFRLARGVLFERLPIQSHGSFALVEILAKANFLGCLMTEIPVSYNAGSGRPVHGSLDPNDSYLAEAYRLFSDASFAPVTLAVASKQ